MGAANDMAREAMIAFLKGGALKPPCAVVSGPRKEDAAAGFLTASFEEGTLFLASSSGEHYRLEWPTPSLVSPTDRASKPMADRRRALPPGEYTLTCYRILRRDARGVEWLISASGPVIRRLTVRTGEEQRLTVDDTIRLMGSARPENGGVEIQLMIAGEKGSGLTVYRNGKRIDIGYRLVGPGEQELAQGTLKYG
jgi:hypothetical protein